MSENKIVKLYKKLQEKYGSPKGQWKLWCKRPKTQQEKERIIIEAILTQRANWKNVELAWLRLEQSKTCSLKAIYNLGKKNKKKLAELIRPSGFYKQKTDYLLGLTGFIIRKYGSVSRMKEREKEKLREELLNLKGIGEETADAILLYALEKPIFVIDEYTRRWVKKHRLANNFSYRFLQELFEKNLKKDYRLYQDFHALIVIDRKIKHKSYGGKKISKKKRRLCL